MPNALRHTFVTSDHHFGSWYLPSFLQVFSREEEKELVEKWNSVVCKDDIVYYNGDFCDCNVKDLCQYAKMLNGQIILVKGNHDTLPDEVYKAVFKDVVDEVVLDGLDLTVHHCPGSFKTKHEIYGHVHRSFNKYSNPKSFCSCVQSNDGYPVSLKKIVDVFHYDLSRTSDPT